VTTLAYTCHVSAGLSADNPGIATRQRQQSRPDSCNPLGPFGVELMFGFLDWEETRKLSYQRSAPYDFPPTECLTHRDTSGWIWRPRRSVCWKATGS